MSRKKSHRYLCIYLFSACPRISFFQIWALISFRFMNVHFFAGSRKSKTIYALILVFFITGCTAPLPDGLPYDSETIDECVICHGNGENNAPPVSTLGISSTSDISVGAHQHHLIGGGIRNPISCEDCHIVPSTVDQPSHIDGNYAEIEWGNLALSNGLDPVWDRMTQTCSSVYCHGSSLSGGINTSPVWTIVDGTQASCGTCHGTPPPPPHDSSFSCYICHPDTVNSDGKINTTDGYHIDGVTQVGGDSHPTGWTDSTLHGYSFFADPDNCKVCHGADFNGGRSSISCDTCHTNGTIEWRTQCNFCHGGLYNTTGAPPNSLFGESLSTSPGVGAHSTHVQESSSHTAWDCNVCHIKPSAFDDPGHIDGTPGAELHFATIAGDSAAYNAAETSCNTNYCHGNGRDTSTISWIPSTSLDCDSCHGYYLSPDKLSERHNIHLQWGCSECHGSIINYANIIIDKVSHIDGTKNVVLVTGTYNPVTHSCQNIACHGEEVWEN